MSLIHLLSKVSSMFYLFLVFHPSKYLFSLVPLIQLHFLPVVVIFKLSPHQFPAPDFFSLLPKTSKDLMRVVASLNWCGDLSRCCCCCNPKNFLSLELKVGAFAFLGAGDLKLPHRFSSFLGVWSLFFSPLEVVYVLRICTSTFSISSSLFALLFVWGATAAAAVGLGKVSCFCSSFVGVWVLRVCFRKKPILRGCLVFTPPIGLQQLCMFVAEVLLMMIPTCWVL
jgi:hypothetical protein